LVVDDSAAVRGAIRRVVEAETRLTVCDEARDGLTAIQKAKDVGCDLVLLDFNMPGLSGIQTAAALRLVLPNTKIIGFSVVAKEIGEQLVAQGKFDAFLSKLQGLTKLVETLKSLTPPVSETP